MNVGGVNVGWMGVERMVAEWMRHRHGGTNVVAEHLSAIVLVVVVLIEMVAQLIVIHSATVERMRLGLLLSLLLRVVSYGVLKRCIEKCSEGICTKLER